MIKVNTYKYVAVNTCYPMTTNYDLQVNTYKYVAVNTCYPMSVLVSRLTAD